ncbi:cytochrome P450 2J2-like [Clupea harengus]|uniref:Cytochrome P450 2J2-like n=1 Tax=Clupea harengus TaxID=7950 RepID=A0A6P3VX83_CLUHA|nr:cytochrome P450 2J2-like [Clupea harengus]
MIVHLVLDLLDLKGWLVVICILLIVADVIRNKDPPSFPPGPWPLPVFGNVFTGVDFKTMEKLTEVYGDVFSLRWGNEKTVFISGYKMVKEALVSQLDSFADRPVVPLFHKVFKGIGIALSNGYMWKIQKKFANAHLRHFGEGRKTLELHIQQECHYLCEAFKEERDPFDPQMKLNSATGNVIISVVFGCRFDYSDERFQNFLRADTEAVLLAGSAQAQLYNAFPGLFHYLPGPHQAVHSNYNKVTDFLRQEIQKHVEDRDPSDPRDYVDVYLGEMEKSKDDEAGFNLETLVVCTLDMVEAGTETVATTLRWGLYFMIKYPEIQEKVQAEIDSVIGQSRFPDMTDRPKLPYTEAVIHETQRLGNVLPLGFPKMASKDTTLGGYFIPKGTMVTANLSSVLNDKNEWATPHLFNPEHFLDAEGRFRRRDAFLPFSAGKRVCLGEQLTRMELFLLFTSLLQRFSFSPLPGVELGLEGVMGFAYSPPPHKICVKPR